MARYIKVTPEHVRAARIHVQALRSAGVEPDEQLIKLASAKRLSGEWVEAQARKQQQPKGRLAVVADTPDHSPSDRAPSPDQRGIPGVDDPSGPMRVLVADGREDAVRYGDKEEASSSPHNRIFDVGVTVPDEVTVQDEVFAKRITGAYAGVSAQDLEQMREFISRRLDMRDLIAGVDPHVVELALLAHPVGSERMAKAIEAITDIASSNIAELIAKAVAAGAQPAQAPPGVEKDQENEAKQPGVGERAARRDHTRSAAAPPPPPPPAVVKDAAAEVLRARRAQREQAEENDARAEYLREQAEIEERQRGR